MAMPVVVVDNVQTLSGEIFVITGTLPGYSRDEAADRIESAGGRVTSSVSKKTDYILAGERAGSKLDKAQALGITILDEAAFEHLLGIEDDGPLTLL